MGAAASIDATKVPAIKEEYEKKKAGKWKWHPITTVAYSPSLLALSCITPHFSIISASIRRSVKTFSSKASFKAT